MVYGCGFGGGCHVGSCSLLLLLLEVEVRCGSDGIKTITYSAAVIGSYIITCTQRKMIQQSSI